MESRTAEIVEAAIAYAERGWRILPVAHDKKPLLKRWPEAATTDPDRIRTWWKASYRSAQIGIACGPGSNLLVIDVDPRHGGEDGLTALADRLGPLPETIAARTPSGGRHLFFTHPAGAPIGNRVGLAPGVDLRGEGGQVVAPPSVTDAGQYTWTAEPGTPLADLPLPWVEFLRPEPRPAVENAPAVNVASPAGIPGGQLHGLTVEFLTAGADEGRRNDALFKAAVDMAGCGRSEQDATAALLISCDLCRPPLGHDEALPTIRSAFGKPRTPAEPPEPDLDWEPPAEGEAAPAGLAGMVHVSNVEVVRGKEDERKYYARRMAEIESLLAQATGGWPRRCGTGLFVVKGGEHQPSQSIWFLANEDDLFAWMQDAAPPYWPTLGGVKTRVFSRQTGRPSRAATRREFWEHLDANASPYYDAVEVLPHEPAVEGLFYVPRNLPGGTGERLFEFAERFNAQTDIDRLLLIAAMITPGWGGPAGARPAFIFTSRHGRGAGKSRTAERIMSVWGGWIQVSPEKEDWTKIKSRLLADSAAGIRCIYIDNLRHKLAGSEIEGIITAPVIEGHKMYHGQASRPNRLTVFLTANIARLSQDLTTRAVPVEIGEPQHGNDWEAWSLRFIEDHRDQLVADCLWVLRQEPRCEIGRENLDRWSLWQRAVLTRFESGDEMAVLVKERRPATDDDADDATDVAEAIENEAVRQGIDPATETLRIGVTDLHRLLWRQDLVQRTWSAKATSGWLSNLCGSSGPLRRLTKDLSKKKGRAWLYVSEGGRNSPPVDVVISIQEAGHGGRMGQQGGG